MRYGGGDPLEGRRVEFQVLGPICVVDHGSAVSTGSPKQRALLAVLIVHANEAVSIDRIVEALWDDPPRSAPKVVRVYVSGLRKALEPERPPGTPSSRIETVPDGYRLRVAASELDSARFERLLGDAAQQPRNSECLLAEALSLWRGRPFSEVFYDDFVQPEVRRLEELRFQAEELLNDVRLELGESGKVLADVEGQLESHQLHEPFWRQHMVALYRSGRQTEALRAYRRACDVFAETGTTPSDELANLEERILLRHPSLDLLLVRAGTPDNLPPNLSSFVGRKAEIEAITDLLHNHRLVTLLGPGGIGKSRLSVEVGRCFISEPWDGIWLIELSGVDPEQPIAPRVISAAMAPRSGGVESDMKHLVDHFSQRSIILVMDNCEHLVMEVAEFSRTLLMACPNLRILATSRRPLGVEGEVVFRIPPLPLSADTPTGQSDAARLFLDRAVQADGAVDGRSLSGSLVDEVIDATAAIPLAIELAASRLGMMSLDNLVYLIRGEAGVLAGASGSTADRHRAMATNLEWSYRLLGPEEQSLFRRLAVFRSGFTLATVDSFFSAFGGSETIELAGNLVSASLVMPERDGRHVLLEPIRQYAHALLEESGELDTAREVHAGVFREMFHVPDSVLFHVDIHSGTSSSLDVEMDNVAAAVAWGLDNDPETAINLTSVAADYVAKTRSYHEALRWYARALDTVTEPTPGRARTLTGACIATALFQGPDAAQRLVDELYAVADKLNDEQWSCAALVRLADISAMRGDHELAYRLSLDAADRLQMLRHPEAGVVLNNCSSSMLASGRFDEAEVVIRRLVELTQDGTQPASPNDELTQINAQIYLSTLAAYRGEAEHAALLMTEADRLVEAATDTYVDQLCTRAHIAILEGDLDYAETNAWELVDFARAVDDAHYLIEGLLLLGLVSFRREDPEVALRFLAEALKLTVTLGHRWLQHEPLAVLAATMALVDPARASELLSAVEAQRQLDRRTMRAVVADAVLEAQTGLKETVERQQLEEARRRGELLSFGDAVALGLEAVQMAGAHK